MRIVAGIIMATLLAGCGAGGPRKIDALIEARLDAGEAVIHCRESNSGICHALFVTEATTVKAEVKQGETGGASALGPETRYCIDARPPDPATCRLRPLVEGEQIVRATSTRPL